MLGLEAKLRVQHTYQYSEELFILTKSNYLSFKGSSNVYSFFLLVLTTLIICCTFIYDNNFSTKNVIFYFISTKMSQNSSCITFS
jgi:hypothetical protein